MNTKPQVERQNSRSGGVRQRPNGRARSATAIGKSKIPRGWIEVACIDFTGYLDRDCEERVVYKTPTGALMAVTRNASTGKEIIEDVSRQQVARWLHECVIPEEFEADFVVIPAGKNEPLGARDARIMGAQDALENSVHRASALNETLALLVSAYDKSGEPLMTRAAVNGLRSLASDQGAELREAFDRLTIAHRNEIAAQRLKRKAGK